MKITLISPKGPLYRHRTGIFKKSLRTAPLTLTTLAALVPRELNATVQIIDEGICDVPEHIDADLIGMTIITGNATRSYELADRYVKQGITVVLGGPHVTLVPEEALAHANCIVTGYAERTWPELLRHFSKGTLQSRYDMAKDFNLSSEEDLPFPKRELLRNSSYKSLHTFEATRGCIHRCHFCVVPSAWGTRPYQKPIHHIVKDIQQMRSKDLVFYDLNLLADFNYAEKLFTALIPLKVRWYGLSTTLISKHPKLMDLMERSGCAGLLIGFESLNPESISAMDKGFNQPENYRSLVMDLHRRGICVNGTFVFGGDEDRVSSFTAVQDFIDDCKMDLPRFSILTPFPGTPLFKSLEKEKRITSKDWSKYDGQHLVFKPKHMGASELIDAHEGLWRKTYSWTGMAKRLRSEPKGFALRMVANLGYRFYARRLHQFYTCLGGAA